MNGAQGSQGGDYSHYYSQYMQGGNGAQSQNYSQYMSGGQGGQGGDYSHYYSQYMQQGGSHGAGAQDYSQYMQQGGQGGHAEAHTNGTGFQRYLDRYLPPGDNRYTDSYTTGYSDQTASQEST